MPSHLLIFCLCVCISDGICPGAWNAAVDQLNGALSGALAVNMLHEVDDYLVPQIRARDIPDGAYKFLSFQIGSNDICKYCAQADNPNGDGSPDDWEANIRAALEAIRTKIRRSILPCDKEWPLTSYSQRCSQSTWSFQCTGCLYCKINSLTPYNVLLTYHII